MLNFKDYQSKPTIRKAYEIQDGDLLDYPVSYTKGFNAIIECEDDGEIADFNASEFPQPGDFIVYISDTDIYHCPRAIFLERNIVE